MRTLLTRRYSFVAGTNSWRETALAASALVGLSPLNEGPDIGPFERAFASAVGTRHAITFGAGRMALYALLEALGVGPGDEVIVPAFTCVVVPNAVLYRGARPVFVDIETRTFNVDPSLLAAKITPRTKAIIAQHTFGLVCDIEEIVRIGRSRGIPVLEDCAHALGAELDGRPAGSLATAAYFSIDHTKMIGAGTGGVATTDDPQLAEVLQAIQHRAPYQTPSRVRQLLVAFIAETVLLSPTVFRVGKYVYSLLRRLALRDAFFCDELDTTRPSAYPSRLSNAQARIGLNQLVLLSGNLEARRRLALEYDERLGACRGLLAPGGLNHSFLRYSFLVDDRETWIRHLQPVLDLQPWFTSVAHGRDADLAAIGYQAGSCPNAELAAASCINLPTHSRMGKAAGILELLARAPGLDSSALPRVAGSVAP